MLGCVTIDGVRFGEWLYWPFGTTSDYSVIVNLYNSLITTVPAKPFFQPAVSFISRSLATASKSEDSSASSAQVLSSQPPVQSSILNRLTIKRSTPTGFKIKGGADKSLALYRKQVTGFKKIIYSTHSP
jgi:hypothetical protein